MEDGGPAQLQRPDHWEDDKLGRWEQAQFLTEFLLSEHQRLHSLREKAEKSGLEARPCHFVLNIDSSWGLGKTFFLKRWMKDLELADHLVLSFDAWANDFSKDPLLSFLGEIGAQLTKRLNSADEEAPGRGAAANAVRWENLKRSTSALLRTYGPSVAKKAIIGAVAASLVGVPITSVGKSNDAEDSQGDGSADDQEAGAGSDDLTTEKSLQKALEAVANFESQDLFQEQNARKKAVSNFKASLQAIVQSAREHNNAAGNPFKLPVFIFVDELDRCRPDFTIELIEVVKHIFSVDDVFFVFATDGKQLQAALEGTYGSRFDAETYFNRIFTREIHLRRPDNRQFAEALIHELGIPVDQELLLSMVMVSAYDSRGEPEHISQVKNLIEDISWVADAFDLTLRDQAQLVESFHSLAKMRSLRQQKTCSAVALVLLVLWQQRRQVLKEISISPGHFREHTHIAQRLRGAFSTFDSGSTRYIVKCSGEDPLKTSFEAVSVCEVVSVFAKLLNSQRKDIMNLRHGRGGGYLFQMHLCEEEQRDSRYRDNSRRVFQDYFDDVMMAG